MAGLPKEIARHSDFWIHNFGLTEYARAAKIAGDNRHITVTIAPEAGTRLASSAAMFGADFTLAWKQTRTAFATAGVHT